MRAFESVTRVTFPAPAGRQVNMMPFVLGDHDSLPEDLRAYSPLIDACGIEQEELGRVGYLTITESEVAAGASQRRGGVHTEAHPRAGWGGGGWGGGAHEERRQGGLYMVSSMEDTTAVWDAQILAPGAGGDCEHLRSALGAAHLLEAGELVWCTDATPHESLPAQRRGTRQFMRVVTSAVDLWYVDHSSANPRGVVPPAEVRLVSGNKFAA